MLPFSRAVHTNDAVPATSLPKTPPPDSQPPTTPRGGQCYCHFVRRHEVRPLSPLFYFLPHSTFRALPAVVNDSACKVIIRIDSKYCVPPATSRKHKRVSGMSRRLDDTRAKPNQLPSGQMAVSWRLVPCPLPPTLRGQVAVCVMGRLHPSVMVPLPLAPRPRGGAARPVFGHLCPPMRFGG